MAKKVQKPKAVSVRDAAVFILEQLKECTTWKLHKLLYYSQAWSLVWDGGPLFEEEIQAWANGPVVPALYPLHKGKYSIRARHITGGSSSALSANQKDTVKEILRTYGKKDGQWLRDLTHAEPPWQAARKDLEPLEPGDDIITRESLVTYYGSLTAKDNWDS